MGDMGARPVAGFGMPGPRRTNQGNQSQDPQRQRVAELFELWWEHHGDAPTKASEIADELKVAIDPQGRGRQFIAKAVEDLAGTRQSGFVLTRAKGAGRKAVATYALKKALTQGDGAGGIPPCPHTHAEEERAAGSMPPAGAGNGDATAVYACIDRAYHGHARSRWRR